MLIAGGIGMGLVAGWLAGRLLRRGRWIARAAILLCLAALALLVRQVGSLRAALWFAAAALIAALLCIGWVRATERRRREEAYLTDGGRV